MIGTLFFSTIAFFIAAIPNNAMQSTNMSRSKERRRVMIDCESQVTGDGRKKASVVQEKQCDLYNESTSNRAHIFQVVRVSCIILNREFHFSKWRLFSKRVSMVS